MIKSDKGRVEITGDRLTVLGELCVIIKNLLEAENGFSEEMILKSIEYAKLSLQELKDMVRKWGGDDAIKLCEYLVEKEKRRIKTKCGRFLQD